MMGLMHFAFVTLKNTGLTKLFGGLGLLLLIVMSLQSIKEIFF